MKIALIGYGKMGKEIEKVARSRGHEIVCIIDINNQDDFESEAFKSAVPDGWPSMAKKSRSSARKGAKHSSGRPTSAWESASSPLSTSIWLKL